MALRYGIATVSALSRLLDDLANSWNLGFCARLPLIGQEPIDASCRLRHDANEDVSKVVRVHAVRFARRNQRIEASDVGVNQDSCPKISTRERSRVAVFAPRV
jgi:hypothetical protein